MRLLILGSTGFAGRHLTAAAEAAGHDVTGAARSPQAGETPCDITDARSVAAAIRGAAPEAVVNLAGLSSVGSSLADPAAAHAVNAEGTRSLLDAVREHAPGALVLCVSSGEVYGHPQSLPLREDHPTAPVNPYGESKLEMERVCADHAERGTRITIARSFNHTGPGQSDAFVASSFARQVAEALASGAAEAVLATGNLTAARDFTDVRDTVRAYLALLEQGLTGTFNVCSGEAMKIERLPRLLSEAAGIPVRTVTDQARMRPVDVPVIYGSAERLAEATGWSPRIPMEATIADMLGWWRSQRQAEATA